MFFPRTDMDQTSFIFLMSVVFLRGGTVMIGEQCKDYHVQFERTFSVNGDAALLNCTLANAHVFNYSVTPYNISWYDLRTGRQLFEETGRIKVRGSMLWFLNTTLEDAGSYQSVLRTPDQCFKQTSVLIVDEIVPEYCGHPVTSPQMLPSVSNGFLFCHMLSYTDYMDNCSIQWYKGCELIQEGEKYRFVKERKGLLVQNVSPSDAGFHTCRLNFNLSGTTGHMSMTINFEVKEEWDLKASMIEPNNERILATYGSPISKRCQVHVVSRGFILADVFWMRQKEEESQEELISLSDSDRVHQFTVREETVENGKELEVLLNFRKVEEEDFSYTYICHFISDKLNFRGNFTLQRSDPDIRVHIALVSVGLAFLFAVGTLTYQLLKTDLALWCRATFPSLYPKPGSDGKVYDAYVVYPGMCTVGSGGQSQAETFALCTLPRVLEQSCGYKLFIYGRDSQPGEGIVDSIHDNITKSSHFLLLYTASTFSEWAEARDTPGTDGHLLFAQQTGIHCALVEETLRVLLVELEVVTDYSTFPESLLHLKRKQGVLQWWRLGGTGPQQFCPSSRFWKLVRYQLPPRGRGGTCPERGTLLDA